MRALGPLLLLLLLCALAGCEAPPQSAYIAGFDSRAATVPAGNNRAGEACRRLDLGGMAADIYCGEWDRPSARIRPGGTATGSDLAGLATGDGGGAAWRAELDARFTCQAPRTTAILGGAPAAVMECQYRTGGWPQLALVASVGGRVWYADTVTEAFDVTLASIGALAGVRADAAASGAAAPDPQLARLLAARSYTASDIQQYHKLMLAAVDANREGDMPGAEQLYRSVIALQEKALGKDAPKLAPTVTRLGLQLSNQGRFAEAEVQFARADALVNAASASASGAPADSDDATRDRSLLTQYRAIDAINRGHPGDALALLDQAEAGYREVAASALNESDRGGPQLPQTDSIRNALAGIVEVKRDRAWALRRLGRLADSDAESRGAEDFAKRRLAASASHSLERETAFVYRTYGLILARQGRSDGTIGKFEAADRDFGVVYLATRPQAETKLLIAAELARGHRPTEALARCGEAAAILKRRNDGVDADLMAPCLDAYAAAAAGADAQPRLDEMFEAAQLIRSSQTNQQIQQAARWMSENTRDPKVGALIRQRDEAARRLDALEAQRGQAARPPSGTAAPSAPADAASLAKLDHDIEAATKAEAALQDQLQAASPRYNQLVPKVVSATDLMAALRPGEAFVQTVLSENSGWTFLLRDGHVSVGRIVGGRARMQTLVQRIRRTLEPLDDGSVRPFDVAGAYELYQAVLGPVADGLKGATALTVAPAGPLLSLPFAVLLSGPAQPGDYANAPWLIKQFAIAHVPEPGNFLALRKLAGTSRATSPWFGFGVAVNVTPEQARTSYPATRCHDAADELAGLPRLETFVEQLRLSAAIMHAGPGDELTGPGFTAAAVAQLPLQRYRVLQFAAHGLLPTDLECESEPAIVTSAPAGAADAGGALLTASQIEQLDLDAELVILSACNSGGPGGKTAGESLSGLARSFFAAQARALLVSHWEVFEVAASALIPDALSKLESQPQNGIAGALRGAQLDWLNAHPGNQSHPAAWAVLAVFGEGGGAAPKPGATTAGLVNYRG